MRLSSPRIHPIPEEEFSESQRDIFKMQTMRGKMQNIFLTLAQHEKLAKRWLVFANHVLNKSTLKATDREILILRIGWLCQSGYEWAQHEPVAREVGVRDEVIDSILSGKGPMGLPPKEGLFIQAAKELVRDATLNKNTFDALEHLLGREMTIDLIITVGYYSMVARIISSLDVDFDDWLDLNKKFNDN